MPHLYGKWTWEELQTQSNENSLLKVLCSDSMEMGNSIKSKEIWTNVQIFPQHMFKIFAASHPIPTKCCALETEQQRLWKRG